ncbi:hypothetical protein M5689_005112 [Euphorbia peplus]|nr:hypothetical protein M5689_005112 [Euphorbia peplus]
MEDGFKQIWEHMQSMDRTSEKFAYGAGVASGAVGIAAGLAFGSKIVFDWVIDRCDEFETRSVKRIMRKIDTNRRNGSKGISESTLPESK